MHIFPSISYDHDQEGWTPIHCALGYDQAEIVEMLVKHGANLDIQNEVSHPLKFYCS